MRGRGAAVKYLAHNPLPECGISLADSPALRDQTVVLATQIPLTRVLPTPQPAAINLIIPSRTDFLKLHKPWFLAQPRSLTEIKMEPDVSGLPMMGL